MSGRPSLGIIGWPLCVGAAIAALDGVMDGSPGVVVADIVQPHSI